MRTRISHHTSGLFPWCCRSPFVVACPLARPRLCLASRLPDLVVVLAGRSFLCHYSLLWLWFEPFFSFSAVELHLLRCLHVVRQRFARVQPLQPAANTNLPTPDDRGC